MSRGRGVIRDEAVRIAAIASARADLVAEGFVPVAEVDSAVHGPKGNVERFVYARLGAPRVGPQLDTEGRDAPEHADRQFAEPGSRTSDGSPDWGAQQALLSRET